MARGLRTKLKLPTKPNLAKGITPMTSETLRPSKMVGPEMPSPGRFGLGKPGSKAKKALKY